MLGKVKRFNKVKGFGFITADDGRDVFFHYSQLIMDGYKTVNEGATVEFDLVEGERGLQAHNIKEIQGQPSMKKSWSTDQLFVWDILDTTKI